MSDKKDLKEKLVETIFEQVIGSIEVSFDEDVYVSGEEVSKALTGIVLEVLKEENTREVIREKVRDGIAGLDPKMVAKALEPEVSRSLLGRLFSK